MCSIAQRWRRVPAAPGCEAQRSAGAETAAPFCTPARQQDSTTARSLDIARAPVVASADLLSDEPEGSLAALLVPVIVVVEAALFGAAGAAIGAVVRREVWDSYTPTETRVSVAVHSGKVHLGVRLIR